MYSRRSALALFLALACASTALVSASYNAPSASYSAPPSVVAIPDLGEAQAAANSNAAGAQAAAARINHLSTNQLHAYGHEIGRPLLVRPYGSLTNLYAAALPPRSLVGRIEPAFSTDGYGNVKFTGESSIAVVVA